jgi:hypothetical protein
MSSRPARPPLNARIVSVSVRMARASIVCGGFSSFTPLTFAAFLSDSCACSQDGWSGGVFTGVFGCTRHSSFTGVDDTVETFCYVKGGSDSLCPCSLPSKVFAGARYRFCSSGLPICDAITPSEVKQRRKHMRLQGSSTRMWLRTAFTHFSTIIRHIRAWSAHGPRDI